MSVSIKHPKLGEMIFLSDTSEDQYPFYYQNGFAFMFNTITPQKATGPRGNKKYKGIINDK